MFENFQCYIMAMDNRITSSLGWYCIVLWNSGINIDYWDVPIIFLFSI